MTARCCSTYQNFPFLSHMLNAPLIQHTQVMVVLAAMVNQVVPVDLLQW